MESMDDLSEETAYENHIVVIHATDLDHSKTGWAGHIPGVWEKRLKMVLFPTIPLNDVFGHKEIKADILVMSKRQPDGNLVPYVFHVINVYAS